MKKLIIVCAFVSLLALVGTANADMVNWATGGVTKEYIGSDGSYPYHYDIVTLSPDSGVLTLELFTPVDVEINPLAFTAGLNRQQALANNLFTMTRSITVNGVMGSLSNVVSNDMRIDIGGSDTLYVYGGPPVRLGDIIITPLGWNHVLVNGGGSLPGYGGTMYDVVSARFELVPVPGAVLLGLLGLGAAGVKLRRFA